jgi:hypothetical protein
VFRPFGHFEVLVIDKYRQKTEAVKNSLFKNTPADD